MTFDEFRATKRWSGNLLEDAPDYIYGEGLRAGFIYAGNLVIELVVSADKDHQWAIGQWELILNNHDFLEPDLRILEQKLYEYAESEDFIPHEARTSRY